VGYGKATHLFHVNTNNFAAITSLSERLKHLVSSNRMSATSLGVAPSGECLRGEGLVWLIGAVLCLLAAAAGPMSVSAGSG